MLEKQKICILLCLLAWAANSGAFGQQTESSEAADKTMPPTLDTRQLCIGIIDGVVQGIRTLKNSAAASKIALRTSENSELLGTWTRESCDSKVDRKRILTQAAKFLTQHSGKAGLVLRLTDANAEINQQILAGYRAAFSDLSLDPNRDLITVDPSTQPNLNVAVAKLILENEVTLISGGLERTEAEQIGKWSGVLRLPAILMNRDPQLTDASPQTFRVFPSPENLSRAIGDFAKLAQMKRVAILRANDAEGQAQSDSLRTYLTGLGILAEPEVTFEPNNFDSIEDAAKKLFKLGPGDRHAEFQKILADARIKARKANQAFNQKMVTMPPQIDFDAVFVPVDFRTARHVAKVFQFLGVKELRIFGNYQWRSRALVDPFDPFLEHSMFADFVGRYDSLPKSVRPQGSGSSMFLSQKDARLLDYRMLGYFSGRVAGMALRFKNMKRNILFRSIAKMNQYGEEQYFGSGPIFDDRRLVRWPAQLLKIIEKNLALVTPEDAVMPTPTPGIQN